MLANNSANNIDTKSDNKGVTDTAVVTPEKPTSTKAATGATGNTPATEQPKRSIGVKEVIPFAWKLLGDACDGMTMTLYKAVERDEVEAHLERTTRDGHYENLRIVTADEKVVQPKVKNPLHYINTPKSPPPAKKVVKPAKVKVIAPKVVRVKRKKVKAKEVKKAVVKKKTKKSATTKKVKKKVAATKKKVTKKVAAKKVTKKKATAKKAPAKKKAATKKKASAKKKHAVTKKSAKKKAVAKKKKK